MKKFLMIPGLLALFMLNVASMCSKDDDNNSSSSNQTQVVNTVQSGTWRITLFDDSGTIKTTNFTGVNFTFGNNNVLTATGSSTVTGTWSVTDSNSNDDTLNDLDFNIAFSTPANYMDLSDDWDIVERTDTKIRLQDVSGGNGGTDYLTFEKN
jgi:hypothetical protein